MKTYRGLAELPKRRRPAVVTVGNFDGVHRGHLATFRRMSHHAERTRALRTVLTFDPHPQEVLHGEAPPKLVTLERKLELLAEAGVDQTVILEFDRSFSQMEPEEFIGRVLVEGLRARMIVAGANWRFGRLARGDATMLRHLGRRFSYTFEPVRMIELEGRRVSSTQIRHAVAEGDVAWANKALGRLFALPGTVVKGAGRGKALGFPTANLRVVEGMCLPAKGIYAGRLVVKTLKLPAAISVGTNPTFGKNPLSIEAFALDFEGELNALEVELEFAQRLRDEQAFPDANALVKAVERDVASVRRILRARSLT